MSFKRKRGLFLLVLGAGIYFIVTLWRNLEDFSGLDERVHEVEEEVEELRRENEELKKLEEKAQSNEFVELEIRDKLGLVKPGETVVILPDEYMEREEPVVRLEGAENEEEVANWKKWWRLFF